MRSRARAALVQGVFLALMGIGIIAVTLYRVIMTQMPEPALMACLGLMALAVNVACAAILLRHREGDANVRAVWLVSGACMLGLLSMV